MSDYFKSLYQKAEDLKLPSDPKGPEGLKKIEKFEGPAEPQDIEPKLPDIFDCNDEIDEFEGQEMSKKSYKNMEQQLEKIETFGKDKYGNDANDIKGINNNDSNWGYLGKLKKDGKPVAKVNPADPTTIPKFVDPMPIPDVAKPIYQGDSTNGGALFYHIVMSETKHRFHRDFPLTTVWGYNGTYPGPIIEVPKDVPVKIKWDNKLPTKHLLPVDYTLHGCGDTPEVRTVVHVHGANVEDHSDGHPEAWFSRDYRFTGPKFSREVYEYTNHQPGATLWYHDHAVGIT